MIPSVLLPLLLTAAGLLAISGVAKLRNPAPAAVTLGVPELLVRGGALVELAVVVLVVARPGPGAIAAAVLYLAFALLVAFQLRAGVETSCGCLGSAQTPPSRVHVVLDLTLTLVCTLSALDPPNPLAALTQGAGALVWTAAATAAWMLVAGIELLPGAISAYRRPTA